MAGPGLCAPGGRGRPAVGVRVVAQGEHPTWAGEPEDRGGRSLSEAAQVLAEAGLDRTRGSALEALDEPADRPEGVLECEPRVALAELRSALGSDVAGRHAQRGGPARPAGEAARRQDRVEQGEAQRGEDRGRAQVALDPLEDRAEADQLARRVQVEQFIREALRAVDLGEARAEGRAHRLCPDVRGRPAEVVRVERRLALLRTTALVATDRAAVVSSDGPCPPRDARVVIDRPGELIGDEHPATGRAARREQVPDRHLEAGVPARRGGHPLERRVEVPDIGRAKDDLREHPGERARFERHRSSLAVQRGAGDPAAAAEQIDHDVARPGVKVDPGGEARWRRCGRDAVEDGSE